MNTQEQIHTGVCVGRVCEWCEVCEVCEVWGLFRYRLSSQVNSSCMIPMQLYSEGNIIIMYLLYVYSRAALRGR